MSCQPPDVRERAISITVEQLVRQYGSGSVTRGPRPWHQVKAISTGLDGLDAALGIGGLPTGRIVEIYGQPDTGKTALALHLARQVPAALYIDADYGITPAQGAGLYMFHADTLEDALTACEIAATGFDLIVIDSLSALPTQADLQDSIGDYPSIRSNAASVLSRVLQRLSCALSQGSCTLILVTQTRENPNVRYGNPLFALGGRALKHYASVRLDVALSERIYKVDFPQRIVIGQKIRVKVVKNKCGPPFREAHMKITYGAPVWRCLKDISALTERS